MIGFHAILQQFQRGSCTRAAIPARAPLSLTKKNATCWAHASAATKGADYPDHQGNQGNRCLAAYRQGNRPPELSMAPLGFETTVVRLRLGTL